jgi:CheY-like chemotaxis protein
MKRVLLVEDDRAIRRIVKHHLVKAGYDAIEAEDGLKALDVARSTPVDLVLLDIRMPMMDGYELAERLAAEPATAAIRSSCAAWWPTRRRNGS